MGTPGFCDSRGLLFWADGMAGILPSNRLIFVSKAKQEAIKNWEEGVSLQRDSGLTITQLRLIVAADRWQLASRHKSHADRLMKLTPAPYRTIISRYYYALYHAMRAAAFIFHAGDDYEEHSKLPSYIPDDFPSKSLWQTTLKDARLLRNRADYDPYPKSEQSWAKRAANIGNDAKNALHAARAYLRQKGCHL